MLIYISFDNTTIALNSNIPSSERHIFQFVSYIRQNFWRTDLTVQKIANDLNFFPELTREYLDIHHVILKRNCQFLIRLPTNTAATGITNTQAIAPNIIDTQF